MASLEFLLTHKLLHSSTCVRIVRDLYTRISWHKPSADEGDVKRTIMFILQYLIDNHPSFVKKYRGKFGDLLLYFIHNYKGFNLPIAILIKSGLNNPFTEFPCPCHDKPHTCAFIHMINQLQIENIGDMYLSAPIDIRNLPELGDKSRCILNVLGTYKYCKDPETLDRLVIMLNHLIRMNVDLSVTDEAGCNISDYLNHFGYNIPKFMDVFRDHILPYPTDNAMGEKVAKFESSENEIVKLLFVNRFAKDPQIIEAVVTQYKNLTKADYQNYGLVNNARIRFRWTTIILKN